MKIKTDLAELKTRLIYAHQKATSFGTAPAAESLCLPLARLGDLAAARTQASILAHDLRRMGFQPKVTMEPSAAEFKVSIRNDDDDAELSATVGTSHATIYVNGRPYSISLPENLYALALWMNELMKHPDRVLHQDGFLPRMMEELAWFGLCEMGTRKDYAAKFPPEGAHELRLTVETAVSPDSSDRVNEFTEGFMAHGTMGLAFWELRIRTLDRAGKLKFRLRQVSAAQFYPFHFQGLMGTPECETSHVTRSIWSWVSGSLSDFGTST